MSAEYPGLPAVAKAYWTGFIRATISMVLLFVIVGSFAGLVVLSVRPGAMDYFILGATVLVFHLAAFALKDVWLGKYDPAQTEWSSWTLFIAVLILISVFLTTLMLISSFGAHYMASLGSEWATLAWVFAAYYPVVDLVLIRQGVITPGRLMMTGTAVVISLVFNLHSELVKSVPVIRSRRGSKF